MATQTFIQTPVLTKAFAFGQDLFQMPDFTSQDYEERIDDLVEEAIDIDESLNESALRTAIENQVTDGFEFESAVAFA